MNTVKVLVAGYAQVNPNGTWDATSTTTLIDTDKLKIIVDPGCHRQLLLKSLSQISISTRDIDYVFLTHYHPDHCLLAGIFEKATVYDSLQWQKGPLGGDISGNILPETDIQIITTPGHTSDHASLLVPTPKGKVLVAGDVFWWRVGEKQAIDVNAPDEFASDLKQLSLSRSLALSLADFIIPGHGREFALK